MKTIILLFLSICASFYTIGQDTIDVVEKTIKVSGLSTETEYYGFAEGDKVLFNLTVENRKDLKDVTISEYPNSVKFADHTIETISNKAINISRRAVYKFDYYNSNVSGRTIKIKIQRIPRTENTKFFNTNVEWVNKVDTSYIAQENTYLISSDTALVNVMDSKVLVNSQTNMDNPNKTVVDFTIPENTIKWTYWIGVGEEGLQAFRQDKTNFIKNGSKLIGSIEPLAGLAFGVISMTHANVGENVKYFYLPSLSDAQKFKSGQSFMQFKSGNVITDFGLMNYEEIQNRRYYLGLENDNLMQGIEVNVKILAVVVNNKFDTVIEKVPTYSNKSIPVIAN